MYFPSLGNIKLYYVPDGYGLSETSNASPYEKSVIPSRRNNVVLFMSSSQTILWLTDTVCADQKTEQVPFLYLLIGAAFKHYLEPHSYQIKISSMFNYFSTSRVQLI